MARRKAENFEVNPYLVDLGQRVLKKRLALGLNVDGLSQRCGLDPQSIVMIETGNRNPTILTLNSIAHGLGTDLYTLLPGNSDLGQAQYAARDMRDDLEALLEIGSKVELALATISRVAKTYPTIRAMLEGEKMSDTITEQPPMPAGRRRKKAPAPE